MKNLIVIMGGGKQCNLIEVLCWWKAQFPICDGLEREAQHALM